MSHVETASQIPLRRKVMTVILLVGTLVATVMRGFRLPNDFAEAHWLFDYRYGFHRRALMGTLYTLWRELTGQAPTAVAIAILGTIALVLTCLCFLASSITIVQRAQWSTEAILLMACFLGSPFFVYVGHINGYLDHVFYILGFSSIVFAARERWLAAGLMQAVAILVHESSLLVLFPSLVLAAWFADPRTFRSRLYALAMPLVAFLALLVAPKTNFQENFAARLTDVGFIQNERATIVPEQLTRSFTSYLGTELKYMGIRFWSGPMLLRVIPLVYFFVSWIIFRARVALKSWGMLLILATTFSAQVLHAIAWDVERIWLYALAGAFFAALVVSLYRPFMAFADQRLRHLAFAIYAMNAFIHTHLMDEQREAFTVGVRAAIYGPLFALMLWVAYRDYSNSDGLVATRVRSP